MSKIRIIHANFRDGIPQLGSKQNVSISGKGGAGRVEALEAIGPGIVVSVGVVGTEPAKEVLVPWAMVVGCEIERDDEKQAKGGKA